MADERVIDVRTPDMGETVSEASLLAWRCRVGDQVRTGQELAELETEKASFFVEAPVDGVIDAILVPAGSIIRGDVVLARVIPRPFDPNAVRAAASRQHAPSPEAFVRLPDGSSLSQRRCRFCNVLEMSGRVDCARCGAPL